MGTLREEYNELEKNAKSFLWDRVCDSETKSDSFNENCIKIDEGNYKEIIIIDFKLQLVDHNDNLSNIEVLSLNELIEILDKY